jgi:hypothetical protein
MVKSKNADVPKAHHLNAFLRPNIRCLASNVLPIKSKNADVPKAHHLNAEVNLN